jgi:NAD(P)-dependent dehydrogenase (short-subunit alcohol dehydrogenase family)
LKSQGIGEAVAGLFAAEGMRLVMTDLKGDVLPVAEDITRRYPSSGAIGVVTEVSDPAACDALIASWR